MSTTEDEDRFAAYVATLGRGPGRSRALMRDEARDALTMVLDGRADPHQVGAFLMLLRYRGEDPEEITGLVEAARAHAGIGADPLGAALDWPSYGAGRTRSAPWFLLAALALARAGIPVLMHGTNAFTSGIGVPEALAALDLSPAGSLIEARRQIAEGGFAYLPLSALSAGIDRLLGLRRLFGLRSPINTVARLLNPANAPTGVDGVFHPAYIRLHLSVAERMDRPRLLVLKGGGGEAERNPSRPIAAHLWVRGEGQAETTFPAMTSTPQPDRQDVEASLLAAIWRGTAAPEWPVGVIEATISLSLLALGRARDAEAADQQARQLWSARRI